jgi:hypothetical protein
MMRKFGSCSRNAGEKRVRSRFATRASKLANRGRFSEWLGKDLHLSPLAEPADTNRSLIAESAIDAALIAVASHAAGEKARYEYRLSMMLQGGADEHGKREDARERAQEHDAKPAPLEDFYNRADD